MSNNALMMAIIATLRPVAAPVAGVVPVGGAASSQTVSTDATHTTGTLACALPAGCLAGDSVVLTCNGNAARSFTWTTPANAAVVIAPTTSGTMLLAVFVVTLAQSDVDAGTVGVPYSVQSSSTIATSVAVDAYRTLDGSPVDVLGSFATGTFPSSASATITAPGITTTQDGDVVQYAAFTATSQGFISSAPPAGWTAGASMSGATGKPCLTGYMVQASEGATGDVPVAVATNNGTLSGAYAIALIALRAYNPTFRLTGTLAAGTVGTPYTGTLTLGGAFVAPVTVTGLPAWMTYSVAGNTVTLGGTPVEGSYTFTPVATDANSQVATGSEQTVVVSAASSAPVLVQAATGLGRSTTGTNTLTLSAAPTAGNTLVMLVQASNTISATTPTGWTLVAKPSASSGQRAIYKRAATGMGATITSPACSGTSNMQVQEWQGAVNVAAAEAGVSVPVDVNATVGPLAAPAAMATPVIGALFVAANPASTTWPTGWAWADPSVPGAFPNGGSIIGYGQQTASGTGTVAITMSDSRPAGANMLWVGAWVSKP